MKKLILILIGIFLISFVSASQETLGIFKQGECVRLIQLCGDCTYNNITSVSYPNSSIALLDKEMTKSGAEFNYTFCNTSELGVYNVNGVGDLGGIDTVWAYNFEITFNGKEKLNTGEGISLFISLVVMIIVAVFFFLVAGKFENSVGKIIFIMLSVLILFIIILYSVVILTNSFGGFSVFTERYSTFFFVMKIIGSVALTVFTLWLALMAFKSWKIHRGLLDRK